MIQLRIHAAPDPKESWLEVDGKKVDGVELVVATEHVSEGKITLSLQAEQGLGVEVVWENWESVE